MQIIKSVMFTIEDHHDAVINAIAVLLESHSIDTITPKMVAEAITTKFIESGTQGLEHWEIDNPSNYFYAMGWFKGKGWDAKDYLGQGFSFDIVDE
jgi:hypothetical protein